jgi:hypothetical protein
MPSQNVVPVTENEFIVTIGDYGQTRWNGSSGGGRSVETGVYYDPQTNDKNYTNGPRSIEDLELSKPYYPEIDGPLIARLESDMDKATLLSIVSQPCRWVGNDAQPRGAKITYERCTVVDIAVGNSERGSANASMLKVKFKVVSRKVGG